MNTIGIIGNGKFGKLLVQVLKNYSENIEVKLFSRDSNITDIATCDIVIPAVQIKEFENVIKVISPIIRENTIVIDVCSVKKYPVEIMKQYLSSKITIVATHPLFGPGTVQNQDDLVGSKIMICFVQGNKQMYHHLKSFLIQNKLEVLEMSPLEHDKLMAKSQFPSHIMANILKEYKFEKTNLDTKTAAILHSFESMIQADSELLKDMFKYNSYCKEELKKFQIAYKQIMNLFQI